MTKKKWAILCSGWGNNVIDIIEVYFKKNEFTYDFEISLIIYDNDEFRAIEVAQKNNIEVLKISKKSYKNSISHQKKISEEIEKRKIDFIFLMNYKYLIQKEMLNNFPNRIINVHPSLFPSFLATKTAIQDAISYGVKITGITTHIIDNEYDKGHILFQVPIKVKTNDNFDTLYPKFKKQGKKIILKTMLSISRKLNTSTI